MKDFWLIVVTEGDDVETCVDAPGDVLFTPETGPFGVQIFEY